MESCGLYIHIPFCVKKCPYCDFYSIDADEILMEEYTKAVSDLISLKAFDIGVIDSIYFGGGTPSLMGGKRIQRILSAISKAYNVTTDCEITLEANPVSGKSSFADYKTAGCNRLSIGVQSLNDSELAGLKRLHNAGEAIHAIEAAYNAGFNNISADLMLAIPHQTDKSLEYSIKKLAKLPIKHISAYMLKVEEGTAFYSAGIAPDEDESADRYLECVRLLEHYGFFQYEISNFSHKGYESRHNLKYWLYQDYLGIGPAAHSFFNGRRFHFKRDLAGFIKNPMGSIIYDEDDSGFEEYAMLRLRLASGLDLNDASQLFPVEITPILSRGRLLEQRGLCTVRDKKIALTPQGFLLSNSVTAKLLFG